MFFLFSGEGATDIGVCRNGQSYCQGADYLHGPMAVIVSQVVETRHKYSLLGTSHYGFASESALVERASELKAAKKKLGLPGPKRRKETRYFYNNASALARIAIEAAAETKDEVVAILFRDADGTASAGRGVWDDKVQSMLDGFMEEGFQRGVPMIPKPKSEAWVLCAVKQNYEGCDALETRSGNDKSPQSLKGELEEYLTSPPDREALCNLVADKTIDVDQLQMPSLTAFRARLEEVI